jgi:hypothetical protein
MFNPGDIVMSKDGEDGPFVVLKDDGVNFSTCHIGKPSVGVVSKQSLFVPIKRQGQYGGHWKTNAFDRIGAIYRWAEPTAYTRFKQNHKLVLSDVEPGGPTREEILKRIQSGHRVRKKKIAKRKSRLAYITE